YRQVKGIDTTNFSNKGNEVAWGTIGNASTSEGLFFETINAAGVLQVPMVMSVWDDEYGISVHARHQTTKENISAILSGFQTDAEGKGYEIFKVNGWDYPSLVETYQKAAAIAREQHTPVLIHVVQLTQPQGHSTSGSHERYKNAERLAWEAEKDCNHQMRLWMLANNIATEEELSALEESIKKEVRDGKKAAWDAFIGPQKAEQQELINILSAVENTSESGVFIGKIKNDLAAIKEPIRKEILVAARKSLRLLLGENIPEKAQLENWISNYYKKIQPKFSSHLHSESRFSALQVSEVKPVYNANSEEVDGRVVLRDNFDAIFSKYPETLVFGEDS